ncbi:T9SS type A sorting domain-containing protein [Candidatus Kapabacteria bacterium]|nr:T9SS type A sorting domain-containing protein [Candidatus Kapabacteria bacterium]
MRLEITVSNSEQKLEPQIVLNNFSFSEYIDLLDKKFAYIYLMSSTGSSYARHEISNWKLCSDSEEDYIVNSLKLDYQDDLIYPNPVEEIMFFNKSGIKTIEIIDIQGSILLKKQLLSNELDVSFLTKGMYFCKVNNETFVKFIKN